MTHRSLRYSVLLLVPFLFACSHRNRVDTNTQVVPVDADRVMRVQEQPQPTVATVAPAAVPETINFADNSTVYFDFDSYTPNQDQMARIANQGRWLQTHQSARIVIEGHTDIYGTREYNLALGERRANAIRNILVNRYNINPNRIRVVSYGEERLADNNVQFRNRRAITRVSN